MPNSQSDEEQSAERKLTGTESEAIKRGDRRDDTLTVTLENGDRDVEMRDASDKQAESQPGQNSSQAKQPPESSLTQLPSPSAGKQKQQNQPRPKMRRAEKVCLSLNAS